MKAVAYSFKTQTVGLTADDATWITIQHVGPPYTPVLASGEYTYAVLCSDEDFNDQEVDYETVKVTAIDDSDPYVLTVERNEESTDGAQEWPEDTWIMFPLTAEAWEYIRTNLATVINTLRWGAI